MAKMTLTEAKQLAADINGCENPQYGAERPERRCGWDASMIPGTGPDYYVVPVFRLWWPGKNIAITCAEDFAALCERDMQDPMLMTVPEHATFGKNDNN